MHGNMKVKKNTKNIAVVSTSSGSWRGSWGLDRVGSG